MADKPFYGFLIAKGKKSLLKFILKLYRCGQ